MLFKSWLITLINQLIENVNKKVVLVCGSGGVGKTTTAAAIAIKSAKLDRKTVVITIDPAARLAQALGLSNMTNEPNQVPTQPNLWAMQLDMKRTFDDLVTRIASPEKANQILNNSFYQTLATTFSGTQEYMAMEKLGELIDRGEWDLIVVDTPPSRSALDFLDAPARLSLFLNGKLARFLMNSGRNGITKILSAGFSIFATTVGKILGNQVLQDASKFIALFDDVFGGFQQRATKTYQVLKDPQSAFIVVATPESAALKEADFFLKRLTDDGMPIVGLIVNRCARKPAAISIRESESLLENTKETNARTILNLHIANVRMYRQQQLLLKERKIDLAVEESSEDLSDPQMLANLLS